MNGKPSRTPRRLALIIATTTAVAISGTTASAAQSNPATAADTAASAGPSMQSSMFSRLDTNRDGYLSRDETRGLINFTQAFDDADDNRDGQLDPDEFAKAQAIHERVRTATYVSDSMITAKVKAALIKDRDVRAHAVNVETFKGTVQLSGFVNSDTQVRRAAEIAAGIRGVVEVRNALIVKS
jgi:hyperosmotically inducible periplasmic protein